MGAAVDLPNAATEQLNARKTQIRESVEEKRTVIKDTRDIASDKTMTVDAVKDDPKGPKKR